MKLPIFAAAIALTLTACGGSNNKANAETAAADSIAEEMTTDTTSVKVEVETTMGNFTVLLYGDTPKHRDNFLKLVKEQKYDSTLFHRVINQFMVQAGDPDSKTAKPGQMLGSGDLGYTIEAEIQYPKHYHKRGALAAARTGDNVNPERRSSSCQFYVVTGQKYTEEQLQQMQMQATMQGLIEKSMGKIRQLQQAGDRQGLMALQQQLEAQAQQMVADGQSPMTPVMMEMYKNQGGAPHLDGQYTVFGEVISGMDTIDKIEKAETDRNDRPNQDIRILSMRVVE